VSRVSTAVKFAAVIGGRRLRRRSGPLLYVSLTMTAFRLVRRVLGRRAETLLVTELQPGEGLAIRALRPGE
jgi:hypothetical protein